MTNSIEFSLYSASSLPNWDDAIETAKRLVESGEDRNVLHVDIILLDTVCSWNYRSPKAPEFEFRFRAVETR